MKLILSPKDNINKITLNDVATFTIEGPTLLVVFEDGRTRNYPLTHLWYYESNVDNHKVGKKVTHFSVGNMKSEDVPEAVETIKNIYDGGC